MPCRVKECGRRGAMGAAFELVLRTACVTQTSFRSGGPVRPPHYIGAKPRIARSATTVKFPRVVDGRLVWLGFSLASPERPDALQFLSVHFPVPAGRLARLFRNRPARQSLSGGV